MMCELMFGPLRFGELRARLPAISANSLTQRLTSFEETEVLRHRRLPPPASVMVDKLTQWGCEAAPMFHIMGRWGTRSPENDPLSPASLMLSFHTMIDLERARGLPQRSDSGSGRMISCSLSMTGSL